MLSIQQDPPVGKAIASMVLIWEISEPADWENRLYLVPSVVSIAVGGES